MILGALEAGGTKMVCSVGTPEGKVLEQASYPTTSPEETMPQLIGFFKNAKVDAVGIGCFGPLDLNPASATYGYITTTPKLLWRNYPILDAMRDALGVPAAIDTDVNAAALAEATLGAASGLDSCLYVTIGTGVGGGVFIGGKLVHGLVHPEFGHMLLHAEADDTMPHGSCPYHDGCLEGLAAGPAIEKRWGQKAYELPADHPAWDLEARYLAQMCVNAIVTLSPEKIILGGGVMQQKHLFPIIHRYVLERLGGYVQHPMILQHIDQYIVEPGLGTKSGVTGALLLAAGATGAAGAKA